MQTICRSLSLARTTSHLVLLPRLQRWHTTISLSKKDKLDVKRGPEVTLYIKGFLSKGETPDDYHLWMYSHNRIAKKHYWDETAKGWSWNCGDIEYPIPFITGTNLAYSLFSKAKFIKGHPMFMAGGLFLDFGVFLSKMIYQYYKVEKNTTILSYQLSAELERLSKKYGKVRVVAHSLGCKLLLNAIKDVPKEYRPNYVHLCAPALSEEIYGPILNEVSKNRTCIYYSPNDVILSVLLQILKGRNPIGSSGLSKHYPNVKAIDVTPYFKNFWVIHSNYNEQFHNFVHEEHQSKIYLLPQTPSKIIIPPESKTKIDL